MKYGTALFLASMLLLASACQADVCPPDSVEYVTDPTLFPDPALPASSGPASASSAIEIGGRVVEVDRVINGPLCNDTWSGSIYVACDIQIAEWADDEAPTFLQNCDLAIEPGTVVYVAAHNNAAYYNGCSCHTGEGSELSSHK